MSAQVQTVSSHSHGKLLSPKTGLIACTQRHDHSRNEGFDSGRTCVSLQLNVGILNIVVIPTPMQ